MALNPVERRLVLLCNDWVAFRADPTKRLLIWQVPDNALRMVECFIEAQKHETEYTSGDLFILLKTPFVHGMQYARGLKDNLRGQVEASVEDLQREGLATDFTLDAAVTPDSPAGLVQALRSFGSKYHKAIGHLVAVLLPSSLASQGAYIEWLLSLLNSHFPDRLRFLLVDTIEHQRFSGLSDRNDVRILLSTPPIDALTTAQETFAQETTVGPAGVFRNLLMGVVSLVEKGTADQVKAKAKDAVTFARKQNWADQEVALRVLLAGALLKESRHAEAVRVYEGARQVAELTVKAEHPAGQKLVLQTWFGQAGAHLAAGQDKLAADCYDQAAAVAQRDQNLILAIEAFRMAGFCLARVGEREAALQRGDCALDSGVSLKPEARGMTTLPVAIVDMLRVLDAPRVQQMQQVKFDLNQGLEAALKHAEQRGSDLADSGDPRALEMVEQELELEQNRASEEALARLGALVSAAPEPFQQLVARADGLLSPGWMVENDIALPALPPPGDTGGPAG